MTTVTRRGGGAFDPFNRAAREDDEGDAAGATQPDSNARRCTGQHTRHRGKTVRKRAGRMLPVAAVAAALAAGTAVYGLGGGAQPQAARLNASMTLPGALAGTPGSGAGSANAAASAPVKVTVATASGAHRTPAKHTGATVKANAGASVAPAARKTAASPAAAAPRAAAASVRAAAVRAARPAAGSSAAANRPAATVSCNLGYGLLPANVTAIVGFLLANGYSRNAAAGIAGNIYQESKGNPESEGMGGGGLIGWTPLPPGFVTGVAAADLQTQLAAVLTFNRGWSSYLPALNAAASPADAASIYVTDFERAGIPAASTREASAQNVASACGI